MPVALPLIWEPSRSEGELWAEWGRAAAGAQVGRRQVMVSRDWQTIFKWSDACVLSVPILESIQEADDEGTDEGSTDDSEEDTSDSEDSETEEEESSEDSGT